MQHLGVTPVSLWEAQRDTHRGPQRLPWLTEERMARAARGATGTGGAAGGATIGRGGGGGGRLQRRRGRGVCGGCWWKPRPPAPAATPLAPWNACRKGGEWLCAR